MLPALGFSQWEQAKPQINVSGSAEIKVAPDEIHISAGVETRDADLNVATRQNDEQMAKALAFLKQAGVADKNIQTDFIRVIPDFGPGDERTVPRFYIARKSVEIKLTSTTNLEAALTGLLSNGMNNILNVTFRTTQLRKYRDQARAQAINAAMEKADGLLKELHARRGKPLRVDTNEYGGWSDWTWSGGRWSWQSGYNRMGFQNVSQNAGGPSDAAGESVSLGQISVSANVTVSFLIE